MQTSLADVGKLDGIISVENIMYFDQMRLIPGMKGLFTFEMIQ